MRWRGVEAEAEAFWDEPAATIGESLELWLRRAEAHGVRRAAEHLAPPGTPIDSRVWKLVAIVHSLAELANRIESGEK